MLLLHMEQRAGLYQRVLGVVSRLGAIATSLPGIILFIARAVLSAPPAGAGNLILFYATVSLWFTPLDIL